MCIRDRLKGIKHKVYGIAERQHKTGHIGIRDRQGLPLVDLDVYKRQAACCSLASDTDIPPYLRICFSPHDATPGQML